MIVGGYAKIFSLFPFSEVEISHIKGNIDNNDTKINIKCADMLLSLILESIFLQVIFFPLKAEYVYQRKSHND